MKDKKETNKKFEPTVKADARVVYDENEPEDYTEHLSLREQGSYPGGGFGLGLERFLMMVTSAPHIRDLTLFPRYYRC